MTKKKALVLGAGMVGSTVAADLAEDDGFSVTVVDVEPIGDPRLDRCERLTADLSDPETVRKLSLDHDIVLGALPSRFGLQTLEAVVMARRDYCDISFMADDPMELNEAAMNRGVTAVVDCGVAPGMSNMLTGFAAAQLDRTDNVEIYVGGLPRERRWPFDYKAGFAPHDVIEEYTRPSRIVEHGQIVEREALSEPELMDFPGIGTLEAFNTDGLRSLVNTIDCPFMKEKTLRYVGHIELMRVFRHTGLFDHEPIAVGADGAKVRPIDVTAALLFPKWTYEPGEADLTVMRVIVDGQKGGQRVRYRWDLLDFFDEQTGVTSMSRTTAFPCTIMARLIADGTFKEPGVSPPEVVGKVPGLLDRVLDELKSRGVLFVPSVEIG